MRCTRALAGLLCALSGGCDGDSGPAGDADSDVDADSDGDTDSDDDCEHPADPVACEGARREEGGLLDEEVCLPGGWFLMGTDDAPAREETVADAHPMHWVRLSPFFLDKYPVTVERYAPCFEAGACSDVWTPRDCDSCPDGPCPPPCGEVDPHSPMLFSTREASEAFCMWDARNDAPGRLPTEAEYERAMVGLGCDPRTFPWREEPIGCQHVCDSLWGKGCEVPEDCEVCGTPPNYCPVDGLPDSATPDGVFAMLGPLATAVADCYAEDYYSAEEAAGPDPLCGPESQLPECTECTSGMRTHRGSGVTWVVAEEHSLAPFLAKVRLPGPGGGSFVRCARDAR